MGLFGAAHGLGEGQKDPTPVTFVTHTLQL